jgi:hypothetical protein
MDRARIRGTASFISTLEHGFGGASQAGIIVESHQCEKAWPSRRSCGCTQIMARSFVESHPSTALRAGSFAKCAKGWGPQDPPPRKIDKDASQTRGYCVAKNATQRAARPDPVRLPLVDTRSSLRAGSSLRKERALRMTVPIWAGLRAASGGYNEKVREWRLRL